MKKFQVVLVMGIIISLLATKATARPPAFNAARNPVVNTTSDDKYKSKNAEAKSEAKASKASSKALSDFNKTFKHEQDVKWVVQPGAIVASFAEDDIQTLVIYDKKGRWIHTILAYQENKMPEDVRSLIKRSLYFDYKIMGVQEIHEGDETFYIVHLENGKKYKQVSVYDGEINVLKEFDIQQQDNS